MDYYVHLYSPIRNLGQSRSKRNMAKVAITRAAGTQKFALTSILMDSSSIAFYQSLWILKDPRDRILIVVTMMVSAPPRVIRQMLTVLPTYIWSRWNLNDDWTLNKLHQTCAYVLYRTNLNVPMSVSFV